MTHGHVLEIDIISLYLSYKKYNAYKSKHMVRNIHTEANLAAHWSQMSLRYLMWLRNDIDSDELE